MSVFKCLIRLKTLNSYEIWKAHVFLFSELVSLWLSASQSAARQRVTIDRVLGVKGGQIQHGGFVAQIRGAFLKTIVS